MTKAARMLCLVLVLGFSVSTVFAQEFTTAQVVAKLDEKAKVFTSLEASISNALTSYDFKLPASSGKLFIKMMNSVPRYLWDVTAPKDKQMSSLIDKGEGTVYFRNSNTYVRRTVDPKTDVLQILLIGFGMPSATLNKNYTAAVKGRAAVGSVQAVVLELTSVSGLTSKFPKVTLWLDPQTWTPVQTRLTEKSGDYTDFTYSNVRLNKGISDSVFRLNIPKDAQKQQGL